VIALSERVGHRTALFRITIQGTVQLVGRQAVGQRLGTRPVIDPHEGIIGHGVADALRGELACQPAVAIAVEL